MAEIKKLTDKNGEEILPITNLSAVYDNEGHRAQDTLDSLDESVTRKADSSIISDAYNPTTTYTEGQYCIDNNTLWRCLVQCVGQKPSEGIYWTATQVGKNLVTRNGEGTFGYLGADDSFCPFKSSGNSLLDVVFSRDAEKLENFESVWRNAWNDSRILETSCGNLVGGANTMRFTATKECYIYGGTVAGNLNGSTDAQCNGWTLCVNSNLKIGRFNTSYNSNGLVLAHLYAGEYVIINSSGVNYLNFTSGMYVDEIK